MEMNDAVKGADWPIIVSVVQANYKEYLAQYSYIKYPAQEYQRFKRTFSEFNASAELDLALLWKWGHWGKANYPRKQGALINEISALWLKYLKWVGTLADSLVPKATFLWWSERLGRERYITTAYLTHLIHPHDVPIIDQHNFRAMNHLMGAQQSKKKPSAWDDIVHLKRFLNEATTKLHYPESDFDKYLMMYGRALKPRKPKTSRKEHA